MNLPDIQSILIELQGIGYIGVFLLMILEGPIITGVAAFLASFGYFNIWVIIILGILGNLIPDLVLYYAGRLGGGHVLTLLHEKLGLDLDKAKGLRDMVRKNLKKGIVIVKFTPGLAILGLVTIGMVRPKTIVFLTTTFVVNVLATLFFAIGGYYTGFAFLKVAGVFSEVVGLSIAALIVLILIPLSYQGMKRRYLKTNKD